MTSHVHIASDGTVDKTGLPSTGELSDGRTVSNYNLLPEHVLELEGWRPLVDEPPSYDAARQTLTRTGYQVSADHVDVTYQLAYRDPYLAADRGSLPADGATVAVVTYTHPDPATAPAQVTFDVNGSQSTAQLTDGAAAIEVTSTHPGPIDITCAGTTLTLQAEEVTTA